MKLISALAALALAGTALAAGEPSVLGDAKLGTLHVTSSVAASARDVELRGGWVDPKVSCRVSRTLTVRISVDYIPRGGQPRRFSRTGRFRTANCAEGGPNVGYTLSARGLRIACPNGRWRPARYHFVTTTTEPTRKLRAVASVSWERTGRC